MRKLFPLLLILLAAADWPMGGRANDRNPVSLEKNAPTDWAFPTKETKARNITWSVKTGGSRNIGGPVVSGGLVWIGTNDYEPDEKRDLSILACYRESDGKPLYRHSTPRIPLPRSFRFIKDLPGQGLSCSPLVEGDRLWFTSNRREIVCLDIGPLRKGTGEAKELWKFDMIGELKVEPRVACLPGYDSYGSLASYKNLLFAFTGNGGDIYRTEPAAKAPSIVCVRKDSGKVVWQDKPPTKDLMKGQYSSPLVVEAGGRTQVIHSQGDGWVRSFDAETGKLIWKFDVDPRGSGKEDGWLPKYYSVATPVFANARVYFAIGFHPDHIGDKGGRLFCIDPSKTGDVSPELEHKPGTWKPNPNSALVWEFTHAGTIKTGRFHHLLDSVAVADGFVVATDSDGLVHVLDEKTGRRHWWHDTKARSYSHPLIVDDKIYVTNEGGDAFVFELSKSKKVLAKIEADASFIAPPVFANGTLYLMTETTLHAIDRIR